MTLKQLGLNGTPLTALTTANSGASAVVTNGGSATYSTTLVAEGTTGAAFTALANQLNIARFTAQASNLTMSYGVAFMIPANPARTWTNFASLRASGAPLKANWTAAGTIDIRDQNNTNPVTFTGIYQPGKAYWLSIRAKVATTTTGTFTANIYDLTTRALIGSASSSTYNLGTVAITGGDIGVVNGDPTAGDTAYLDLLSFDDGSTAEILPPAIATNYQAALPLTAAGTVANASTVAGTSALPLTSSANLAQTATNAANAAQALTGAGTLAQGSTAALTGAQALTGSGSLTQAATVQRQAASAQTATGSLDMATTATRAAALALTSVVTLTLDSQVTRTARLDLTATSAVQIDSTQASVASLQLTAAGALTITSAGTDHYDVLDLVAAGQLTIAYQGAQRDITVTATIAPRTWGATLAPRTYAAAQQPRRWDAHADVPA